MCNWGANQKRDLPLQGHCACLSQPTPPHPLSKSSGMRQGYAHLISQVRKLRPSDVRLISQSHFRFRKWQSESSQPGLIPSSSTDPRDQTPVCTLGIQAGTPHKKLPVHLQGRERKKQRDPLRDPSPLHVNCLEGADPLSARSPSCPGSHAVISQGPQRTPVHRAPPKLQPGTQGQWGAWGLRTGPRPSRNRVSVAARTTEDPGLLATPRRTVYDLHPLLPVQP